MAAWLWGKILAFGNDRGLDTIDTLKTKARMRLNDAHSYDDAERRIANGLGDTCAKVGAGLHTNAVNVNCRIRRKVTVVNMVGLYIARALSWGIDAKLLSFKPPERMDRECCRLRAMLHDMDMRHKDGMDLDAHRWRGSICLYFAAEMHVLLRTRGKRWSLERLIEGCHLDHGRNIGIAVPVLFRRPLEAAADAW